MEEVELTCIICPNGCALKAQVEDGEIIDVTGNSCLRGYAYAQTEVLNPTRIVTSTISVEGGELARVPVKTSKEIPKAKIMDCAAALKGVKVKAPIAIGDVLVHNVEQTGSDIVATGNVPVKSSLL